jgi:cutinase
LPQPVRPGRKGASATDIAIGLPGSTFLERGESVAKTLASRIAAVVVFGNPLSNFAVTIESTRTTYGPKAKPFSGNTDTVCGGSRDGNIDGGHLDYRTNEAIDQALAFAVARVTES